MKETLYYALAKITKLIDGLHLALDADPVDDEDITSAAQILTANLLKARSLATAQLPVSKRPTQANATTPSSPSSTTPVHAFRKRSMYVPGRSASILELVYASTARGEKSGSAHRGRKRCRLRSLLKRQPKADDKPLFVNRYGAPLGASGVRFKLAEYVEAGANIVPSLRSKHVTPHSFRHATAVHLLAAGVDITVIRSWLGRVSLDTTNHYAQADLDTKRKALEQLDNSSRPSKPLSWKQDESGPRGGIRFSDKEIMWRSMALLAAPQRKTG